MKGKMLVVHGGGPTAVMNASLYGVLEACEGRVDEVLGALGGTGGLLRGRFASLSRLAGPQREALLRTPGSVLGTSRTPLEDGQYRAMAGIARAKGVRWILFNGGNGTMDACGRMRRACGEYGIGVVGVPKTVDNDIAVTDHAPGYGSAARYMAVTVSEVAQDVRSLPIHVCIIEAMGRNAGWLAASAALAADAGYGPDLIYLPERPFDEERFLSDVKDVYDRRGCAVVVASEGLCDRAGASIVPPIFRTDRAVYYGDVGAHLAGLVVRRLGVKARSEKPGLCGRASCALQSPLDREEAAACGRRAAEMALAGETGAMVTLRRPDGPYRTVLARADIDEVMLVERTLPGEWINRDANGVTDGFTAWCRPLLGGPLPRLLPLLEQEGEDA